MGLFDNKKDNNFGLFTFMNDEDDETSSDELDNLGLSEFQKEEVEKGNYDTWNFDEEELEDDDFFNEDDD